MYLLLTPGGIGLLLAVAFLDGMLSIDNALANAAIAQGLPELRRANAIRLGLLLGYVFRIAALLLATFIAQIPFVRFAGACYLLYLAWAHFKDTGEKRASQSTKEHFYAVILAIGLTDIALSIDNIVAVIGLSSDVLILTCGVFISLIAMTFATEVLEHLLRRYRRLVHTAFIIIAFLGFSIIVEFVYLLPGLGFLQPLIIGDGLKIGIIVSLVLLTIVYEELQQYRRRRTA